MKLGQTSAVYFLTNVGTSVVGFLATLYFTHNLAEGTLGSYFLLVAVLIWLNVVFGRTIQKAMGKRLSESQDGGFVGAGILIQAVAVVIVIGGLLIAREQVNGYIGSNLALPLAGLVVVTFAFSFVQEVLKGRHAVHLAGVLQLFDRGTRSVVQVGAVALGFGLVGLVVGYGVAALLAAAVGLYWAVRTLSTPAREHVRSLLSFAQYSWLGMLGGRAFASMDTIVLGLFVAKPLIAYYEIAWNVASILGIFGIAVSETLFPEISRLASEGDHERIRTLLEDALAYAGLFLVPGLVGSLLIGDRVLDIYGNAYSRAGTVLVVLLLARVVYAYEGQLANALNGTDNPELAFRVNAVFLGTNVVGNLVLVYLFGWIGAAVATAGSALIALMLAYWYLDRLIQLSLPYGELWRQTLAAGMMAIVVYLAALVLPRGVYGTVMLVGCGGVVYLVALIGLSPRFQETLLRNLPV